MFYYVNYDHNYDDYITPNTYVSLLLYPIQQAKQCRMKEILNRQYNEFLSRPWVVELQS